MRGASPNFSEVNIECASFQWPATTRFGHGAIGKILKIATRWDVMVAAALMALVSFSVPGRDDSGVSGGLDFIAISKLAIRLLVIAWFGSFMLLQCSIALAVRSKQRNLPVSEIAGEFVWRGQWTDPLLLPWWCFAAWSLVTVTWSPMFSVSFGQWLGLIALLALAQVISNRYAMSRSFQWQTLAKQLNIVLAVYSLMVLIAHVVSPETSGLDRSIKLDGSNGLFHPTAAGATSSLGLILAGILFLQRVTSNVPIPFAMMALHFVVLYWSASRSALAMAFLVGMLCFLFLMPNIIRASILILGGIGLLLMVCLDPGFELASLGVRDASSYVQRGQSTDQLREASGRTELWQAIWKQIKISPVVGHGYFLTSSNGRLEVWGGATNQDAHNVGLQVLVSTGMVGSVIFIWAMLVSGVHLARSLNTIMLNRISRLALPELSTLDPSDPKKSSKASVDVDFVSFAVIVAAWFFGWAQGCVSFLGPIRPEAVAFFGLLGLLAAHARITGQFTSQENSLK